MKLKDVKVGMKVVPHDKTTGACTNFKEWQTYHRESCQHFKELGYCVVSEIHDNKISLEGDYFNAADFEPYIEQFALTDTQKRFINREIDKRITEMRKSIPELILSEMAKSEPKQETIKEKFVPHLKATWCNSEQTDLGEIGMPTNRTDAINRPLFVGDTVESYDGEGLKRDFGDENFVCCENGRFQVMGCYSEFENPSAKWRFLKKRSFSEIKNGEKINDVKCIKEG